MSELRAALEKAYEDVEEVKPEVAPPVAETPVVETPAVEAQTETPVAEETAEQKQTRIDRARDEHGKFVKKQAEAEVGKLEPSTTKPEEAKTEQPVVEPTAKPPSSWKAVAREHWDKVPKEVREEIYRREADVARGLTQSSNARNFVDSFSKVVEPYQDILKEENATPLQAVANLMQTAAVFRKGSPEQKARLAANFINHFQVDVSLLDDILSKNYTGKPAPEEDRIARIIDQRLQPINSLMSEVQRRKQEEQQVFQQEIAQELDSFVNDPTNEFYNDVAQDMAYIMDSYANRGEVISLKNAYDMAVRYNPEVQKVINSRKQFEVQNRNADALNKARSGVVSVTGAPNVGAPVKGSGSIRDNILAAMENLQSR